ncbi:MAG: AAA family ATPase, partial [Lachnospiraceae bacterium]|nr:AAA family ATPase [Lachnospiraceae bacterium]
LLLSSFEPYAKNPPISKVFREIGLADELGSGMRNTYKYTRLYSGGTPEFIEDDVFRTIVPLAPVAVEKVGPQEKTQVTTQVKTQVTTQVTITDKILAFCHEPHSKSEIAEHCGYKNTKNFTQKYLRPLLDTGKLQMTIPDKPRSQNQKYITSER